MRESQKVGIVRMTAVAEFKKKHGDVKEVKIPKKIELGKCFEVSGKNLKGDIVIEHYCIGKKER